MRSGKRSCWPPNWIVGINEHRECGTVNQTFFLIVGTGAVDCVDAAKIQESQLQDVLKPSYVWILKARLGGKMAHDVDDFEVDIDGRIIDVVSLFAHFKGLYATWATDDPPHKVLEILEIAAKLPACWKLITVVSGNAGCFQYFFQRNDRDDVGD